ncbi:MAG TPA: hypothetical protein VEQ10_12195 [Vicinamibacteria bacterium]|nr:hypothetical protein [Vicinamibacteria bacterium]
MTHPVNVLTDCVLALVALLAWRLLRERPGSGPAGLWAASFAALGVGALLGGTWHALPLPPEVPARLREALWSSTYVAVGLSELLLLAGAAQAVMPRRAAAVAAWLLAARFLLFAGLVVRRHDFRDVAVEVGLTLVLLSAFALELLRRREPAAVFVACGLALTFAGGLVQWLGLRPHPSFDDNDLTHLIQCGATWLLFRGALRLRAR